MHAIVRRYEGIDTKRTDELKRKVGDSLTPRLKKLDGFNGYFLIEADNGVMSTVNFFDTSATSRRASWPSGYARRSSTRLCRIRPRSRVERSSSMR
jgi:hypothetical protein